MTASSSVVISNLAYLVGAVVLAIIGGLVVWLRHRKPKSVAANVESFHRGLRALAPDGSPTRGDTAGAAGASAAGRVTALPGVRLTPSRPGTTASNQSPTGRAAEKGPEVAEEGPGPADNGAGAGEAAADRAGAETG
jgi:hypothetical protein